MLIQNIWHGDCLELMANIPSQSIDMVLCDLPYEVTARQKWDVMIPLIPLWDQYNRIIKDHGAILLFAVEPFRTQLICTNMKYFRYDLIWRKNKVTGFLNAKKQPLRQHESILVFYKKPCCYNPQKTTGHKPVNSYRHKNGDISQVYGKTSPYKGGGSTERYPTSILTFNVINNDDPERKHPAQKPLDLCEYLIKTYTNENDLVLDNCAGSGTSLVAAKRLSRQYIGIEKEQAFYDICVDRLKNKEKNLWDR